MVDRDDVARAEQPRTHDGGEPDRPRSHHGDDIAGTDAGLQDADLVAGRQYVGQHQGVLVADAVRQLVRRHISERHADVFRLRAVDGVAEDPTAAVDEKLKKFLGEMNQLGRVRLDSFTKERRFLKQTLVDIASTKPAANVS